MTGYAHRFDPQWTDEALNRVQSALVRFSQRAFYVVDWLVPRVDDRGDPRVYYHKQSGIYFMHPQNRRKFREHMRAAGLIPTPYGDDRWMDE